MIVIILELMVMALVIGFCVSYVSKKRRKSPLPSLHEFKNYAPENTHLFTLDLVRSLEWRRFEMLSEHLFNAEGYHARRIRAGADGGVDLALCDEKNGPLTAIAQCKAWTSYKMGVKPIRELYGVMAAESVPSGYFLCIGDYTKEAHEWAKGKPLSLISGKELVERLNSLDHSTRSQILKNILTGDYTTPTCPNCDVKMKMRSSRKEKFWGCSRYPRCRHTFRMAH